MAIGLTIFVANKQQPVVDFSTSSASAQQSVAMYDSNVLCDSYESRDSFDSYGSYVLYDLYHSYSLYGTRDSYDSYGLCKLQ